MPEPGQGSFLGEAFTEEELNMVTDQFNKKSSPDLDEIDYMIISHLFSRARSFLLDLYNKFFCQQAYPESWKEFMVFFIPKDESRKKFRPISLSSCLDKIMERMVCNRLN